MRTVAISQRVEFHQDRGERRDSLDQRLANFALAAGLLPVPIPNVLSSGELNQFLDQLRPAALILSGGGDVGADPDRDVIEREALGYAAVRVLPVLGICRGMQQMASAAGARLIRVTGHVATRHTLGAGQSVNSFHEWAVEGCPAGYTVTQRAEDGVIEAIEHSSLPWMGVMWHPEREVPLAPSDVIAFHALISRAEEVADAK